MLITNLSMSLSLFPPKRLLTMFTNWAQMITELGLILVIFYGQKRDINSCKGTLAFIHIILELALAFNIVVVIVYWCMLHPKVKLEYEGYRLLHMYLVHIFPAVSLLLTLKTIHFNLYEKHWIFLVMLGNIYAPFNYLETKARGKPVYWFLTWESYDSFIILFVIYGGFVVFWITLARCTKSNNSVKGKTNHEK